MLSIGDGCRMDESLFKTEIWAIQLLNKVIALPRFFFFFLNKKDFFCSCERQLPVKKRGFRCSRNKWVIFDACPFHYWFSSSCACNHLFFSAPSRTMSSGRRTRGSGRQSIVQHWGRQDATIMEIIALTLFPGKQREGDLQTTGGVLQGRVCENGVQISSSLEESVFNTYEKTTSRSRQIVEAWLGGAASRLLTISTQQYTFGRETLRDYLVLHWLDCTTHMCTHVGAVIKLVSPRTHCRCGFGSDITPLHLHETILRVLLCQC